jgi:hypothetical protein
VTYYSPDNSVFSVPYEYLNRFAELRIAGFAGDISSETLQNRSVAVFRRFEIVSSLAYLKRQAVLIHGFHRPNASAR